jgi:Ca2+-binding EF-hand superfamily protein
MSEFTIIYDISIINDEDKFNEICKNTFEKFDKDKSGFIEANEFVQVMKYFCKENNLNIPTQCDTYDKFKSLDKNKDGKLSLEEFSILIKEIIKKEFMIK